MEHHYGLIDKAHGCDWWARQGGYLSLDACTIQLPELLLFTLSWLCSDGQVPIVLFTRHVWYILHQILQKIKRALALYALLSGGKKPGRAKD